MQYHAIDLGECTKGKRDDICTFLYVKYQR